MRRNGKVYIAEALIFMLLTDELEDIKICDLCRRAGVSRMTYYRYFNEKSEILEFYMDYLFEEFLKKEQKLQKKSFRTVEHIVDCLDYFRGHSAFALCLYKAGLEGVMLKAINRYMRMKLEEEFNGKRAFKEYMLYAYAGSIYNCYMQWILNDFDVDVQTLAQIIAQF